MAESRAVINVDINTSDAAAGLRSLQAQLNAFNTTLTKSSAIQSTAIRNAKDNLIELVSASRFFTAETVRMQTAAASLDKTLSKGQVTLGQFFSAKFKKDSLAAAQVLSLAETRAAALQTQFVSTGAAANGMREAIAIKPLQAFNSATVVSAQKLAIHRAMLNQATTSMINFGKNTQWAGRQLMVGFTVPLTIFAGVAGKSFMELEKAAISFRKVYGDAFTPPGEMESNLQAIQELAKEYTKYGIAVKDTISLAAEAAAAGARNKNLVDATTQATRLATLGQMEQNDALQTTIALQNAFALSGDDLAKSINFLNMVENQTVVTLQDLSAAIPRVAPVIKGLGGSVEDMAAMLAAMQEGGVSAEQGANALKSGLASLINPTDKAVDKLNGMGIALNQIVQTNRGDLMGTVQDFARALQTLDQFQRQQALETVFGKFQYARLGALFNNIIKDGSQASRVMETAALSAEQLAASAEKELGAIEESPATKFTAAMEKLQLAIAPIGEMFTKMAIPVVNFFVDVLEKFNNLPDFAKKFLGLGTVIVGIVIPAGTMFLGLIMNLIGTLTKFGSITTSAFKGFISGGIKGAFDAASQSMKYMSLAEIDASLSAEQLAGTTSAVNQALLSQVGASESAQAAITELGFAYEILTQQMREAATANEMVFGPGAIAMGAVPKGRRVKRNRGGTIPGSGNTDTVPAMLTPGEFVVNKQATQDNLPLLKAINNGNMLGFQGGGPVAVGPRLLAAAQRVMTNRLVPLGTSPIALPIQGGVRTVKDLMNRRIGQRKNVQKLMETGATAQELETIPIKGLGALVLRLPGTTLNQRLNKRGGLPANEAILAIADSQLTAEQIFEPFEMQMLKYMQTRNISSDSLSFSKDLANAKILELLSNRGSQSIKDADFESIVRSAISSSLSGEHAQGFMNAITQARALKVSKQAGTTNEQFARTLSNQLRAMNSDASIRTTVTGRKTRVFFVKNGKEVEITPDFEFGYLADLDDGIYDYTELRRRLTPVAGTQLTHANSGGYIVPGQGNKDTVPAMLTPGEFVVNKKATQSNMNLLQAINGGQVKGYALGGLAAMGGSKALGLSMGLGSLGGAMSMAPMIPGVGQNETMSTILQSGGMALGLASMLPMLGSGVGAAIAAIASVPLAIFAFDKHMKSVTEEARKLGDAISVSSGIIQGTADAFGRQLLVTRQKAVTRKETTGVTSAEAEQATRYLAEGAGKVLKEETELALANLGSGPAMKGLAQKMSSLVLMGAINPKQAKAIVTILGEEIGNQEFGLDVVAQIKDMIGENGRSVRKQPYKVAVEIITNQAQVEQTLAESLQGAIGKASDVAQLGGFFTQQVSKEGFFSSDSLGAITANIVGFGTTTTTAFQDIAYVSDIARNVLGFFNQDVEVAIAQSQMFGKVIGNNVRNSYDVLNATIERNRILLEKANKEEKPELRARFLREEEQLRRQILASSEKQAQIFAGYNEGFQAEILKGIKESSLQLYENDPTMKAIVENVFMRTGSLDKTIRFNIETAISTGMINPSTVEYFFSQFNNNEDASAALNFMIKTQGLTTANEQLLGILNMQDKDLQRKAIIQLLVQSKGLGAPGTEGAAGIYAGTPLAESEKSTTQNIDALRKKAEDAQRNLTNFLETKGYAGTLENAVLVASEKVSGAKTGLSIAESNVRENLMVQQPQLSYEEREKQIKSSNEYLTALKNLKDAEKELTDATNAAGNADKEFLEEKIRLTNEVEKAQIKLNEAEGDVVTGKDKDFLIEKYGTEAERGKLKQDFWELQDSIQTLQGIKIGIDIDKLDLTKEQLATANSQLEIFQNFPPETLKIIGVNTIGSPEQLASLTQGYEGLESKRPKLVKQVVMNVLGSQGVSAETAIQQIKDMGYSMEQFAALDNVTKYNILFNLEIEAKLTGDIATLEGMIGEKIFSADRMEGASQRLKAYQNQLKQIKDLLKGLSDIGGDQVPGAGPEGGGAGGAAEKTLAQELAAQAKLSQEMFQQINKPQLQKLISGPFAPEFLEYLRSQGQKGLDLLKSSLNNIKQAYRDFIRDKSAQMAAQAIIAPMLRLQEIKLMKEELALRQQLRNEGRSKEEIDYIVSNTMATKQMIIAIDEEIAKTDTSTKKGKAYVQQLKTHRAALQANIVDLRSSAGEYANLSDAMELASLSARDLDMMIYQNSQTMKDLQRRIDEIRIINPLQKQLDAQQKILDGMNRTIELRQREADAIGRNIELKQRELEPIDKQIEAYENQIDTINESYDIQLEALDKIYKKEEDLAALREGKRDVAAALARGDVSAAAQAALQLQRTMSAQRQESARNAIEQARQQEVQSVEANINGLKDRRKIIEDEIAYLQELQRQKQDEIYDIQQNMIPVQDSIYNLNKLIADEADKLDDLYRDAAAETENLKNQLAAAAEQAERLARARAAASAGSTGTTNKPTTGTSSSNASNIDPEVGLSPSPSYGTRKPTFTGKDEQLMREAAFGGMIKYRGSREVAPGFMMGGKIKKYAAGSFVPGRGMTDKVPALLTPGEFVVRKSVAQAYRPLLENLNGQVYPKMQAANAPIINSISSNYRTNINPSDIRFEMPTNISSFSYPQTSSFSASSDYKSDVTNYVSGPTTVQYNYSLNVSAGTNATPDDVANAIMYKIKRLEDRNVKGTQIG